jgi:hypothetical protein
MDRDSFIIILGVACVPLVLIAAAALLGSRFKRSIGILIKKGQENNVIPKKPKQDIARLSCGQVPLVLRRVKASDVGPATGQTAVAVAAAELTTRTTRLAYIASGLAYSAIATFAITSGMAAVQPRFSTVVEIIMAYLMQWPPLVMLVFFLGISLRLRVTVLAIYALAGLPLAASNWNLVSILSQSALLWPMAGLVLLLARPLRPWLVVLVAILLFLLAEVGMGLLIGLDKTVDLSRVDPWQAAAGAIFQILAVVYFGWILRRRKRLVPVALLAFLGATGLLAGWLFPDSKVGPISLGPLLVGLPGNVLGVFAVWLVFRLFVRLQERQLLPARLLHSDLCWGFYTLYLIVVTIHGSGLYGHEKWVPWGVLLAYTVYLGVLHTLSRRIWVVRAGWPGKRLLLLRVFGRADKREKLLDALDDAWCRVGRIDLIAGPDLATRTMGARMLEAFLLRRADEQFLKTVEEVELRLSHLHSVLDGDARYPANCVYCFGTTWQGAIERLAPNSDAILMDLRGFTKRNEGCVFELTWLVQQIPLSRIVLLADGTTDDHGMEEVIRTAWAELPPGSPNVREPEPFLKIFNPTGPSRSDTRALAISLLSTSYETRKNRGLEYGQ